MRPAGAKSICGKCVLVVLFAMGLAISGCGREFALAAAPALEAGVGQILDGLLEGIFAAITPDASSSGS